MAGGHDHDVGEQCDAEKMPGKFCFFPYQDGERVKGWHLILDHCPIASMTPADARVIRYARMHAADSRVIDLGQSSADMVEVVLELSGYLQGRQGSGSGA